MFLLSSSSLLLLLLFVEVAVAAAVPAADVALVDFTIIVALARPVHVVERC